MLKPDEGGEGDEEVTLPEFNVSQLCLHICPPLHWHAHACAADLLWLQAAKLHMHRNAAFMPAAIMEHFTVLICPHLSSLQVSYKPQKISPKFEGSVRQLLHKRIRDAYLHPQVCMLAAGSCHASHDHHMQRRDAMDAV